MVLYLAGWELTRASVALVWSSFLITLSDLLEVQTYCPCCGCFEPCIQSYLFHKRQAPTHISISFECNFFKPALPCHSLMFCRIVEACLNHSGNANWVETVTTSISCCLVWGDSCRQWRKLPVHQPRGLGIRERLGCQACLFSVKSRDFRWPAFSHSREIELVLFLGDQCWSSSVLLVDHDFFRVFVVSGPTIFVEKQRFFYSLLFWRVRRRGSFDPDSVSDHSYSATYI